MEIDDKLNGYCYSQRVCLEHILHLCDHVVSRITTVPYLNYSNTHMHNPDLLAGVASTAHLTSNLGCNHTLLLNYYGFR